MDIIISFHIKTFEYDHDFFQTLFLHNIVQAPLFLLSVNSQPLFVVLSISYHVSDQPLSFGFFHQCVERHLTIYFAMYHHYLSKSLIKHFILFDQYIINNSFSFYKYLIRYILKYIFTRRAHRNIVIHSILL